MGHYFESGSILWAGIVVLAVAALLHCSPDAADRSFKGLPYSALLLSLTGMALNGVAGVIGLAVVAGFALVRDRGLRGLAFAAVAALLFRLFQHLMGLDQPLPQNNSLLDLAGLPFRLPRCVAGIFPASQFSGHVHSGVCLGIAGGQARPCVFGLASLGLYVLCDLQGYPLGILAVVLAGFAARPGRGPARFVGRGCRLARSLGTTDRMLSKVRPRSGSRRGSPAPLGLVSLLPPPHAGIDLWLLHPASPGPAGMRRNPGVAALDVAEERRAVAGGSFSDARCSRGVLAGRMVAIRSQRGFRSCWATRSGSTPDE